jgi:hypothetical protein
MIRVCDNGHPPVRLESGTRCRGCERRRGTRQARGYGAQHQTARRAILQAIADAGGSVPCAYGWGTTVTAETVVAAILVDIRASYGWMASCRRCNEAHKCRGLLR